MYRDLKYYVRKYVPYQLRHWTMVDVSFFIGYSTCLFTVAMYIWCPRFKCLKFN